MTEDASEVPRGETPVSAPTRDERLWATFCHVSALAVLLFPLPVVQILAPLVVWLIKRQDSAFVDFHGKESLNFQISWLIYMVIAAILISICIGIVLLPALVIADVVLVVIAAIRANDGLEYRYPLTLRFIK